MYVLKGSLKVWLDGNIKEINEEEFAAFPSNTGMAHTLINDTDKEVIYLCIDIKRSLRCKKIRLGVSKDNEVSAFWRAMGFRDSGSNYDWRGEQKTRI